MMESAQSASSSLGIQNLFKALSWSFHTREEGCAQQGCIGIVLFTSVVLRCESRKEFC